MPLERRSEIPSEGDARRCSYEVHVAPCAGVGAAVVDTSIENGTLGSIRYTGATISKRSALKMYLRPYE